MNFPTPRNQLQEAFAPFVHAPSLSRVLQDKFGVSPLAILKAAGQSLDWEVTLGEVLVAEGVIDEPTLIKAYAQMHDLRVLRQSDLELRDPAPEGPSPQFCAKHNVVFLNRTGRSPLAVTGRPERMSDLRKSLPKSLDRCQWALSTEAEVAAYLEDRYRKPLTLKAEARPREEFSCRPSEHQEKSFVFLLAALITLSAATALFPLVSLYCLLACVLLAQCATFGMKFSAAVTHFLYPPLPPSPLRSRKLPRISVMVPLFKEDDIAGALIKRLSRLTYPKALLDVLLVLEEQDAVTHRTLQRTTLPEWMRVITVPAGSGVTTKPRALNYALDFCRGDIVGIWDAEDAPAPDQLEKVSDYFANAPEDVACVQGILDYYNPFTNWISRCFTIEYATWFRIVLPGLAKLGFAIPLGGTTLFLKRDVIEEVGGWDAHNVTEDADLGIRLARFGYRTELLPCVTQEEANSRPIAWIKQRSRWLKGYMITYLVHMRAPYRLAREIGWRKVFGLQLVFAATLSQFLLAPLLWMFWGSALGFELFSQDFLPANVVLTAGALLTLFGVVNASISLWAISGQERARLYPWVLTMIFYFPLATFAAYKALYELLFAPYFWDKTAHGKTQEGLNAQHSDV